MSEPASLLAQEISVGSESSTTRVNSIDGVFSIDGGELSSNGENLFHQFQSFGLSAEQSAIFLAEPSIQNIIGSITGGELSFIDGVLQTSQGANLFLLNPAGFLFGANVELNLTGNFTAATATHLEFETGLLDVFGESDYQALVGEPTGFIFNSAQPGPIVNTGTLALQPDQALTLLGGAIANEGQLISPDGSVTVASVPGEKLVRINQAGDLLGLEIAFSSLDESSNHSSDLSVHQSSMAWLSASVTGGNVEEANTLVALEDGSFRLQSFGAENSSLLGRTRINGEVDVSGTTGGSITILGDLVELIDSTILSDGLYGGGQINIGGAYQGGERLPTATNLLVDVNTLISANAFTNGNAGNIVLWAENQTSFLGNLSAKGGISGGDGGFAEISGKGYLEFLGQVDLEAPNGSLGNLLLDPETIVIVNDLNGRDGDSSLPQISVEDVPGETTFLSQTAIQTLSENTNIQLEATGDIRIERLDNNTLALGGNTSVQPGNITFLADADQDGQGSFQITGSNQITTNGGDLRISGASILTGNIFTGSNVLRNGGDIELTATFEGGTVTAGSLNTGEGDVGSIKVTSQGGNIVFDSFITTSSGPGDSDAIELTAAGDITVEGNIVARSRADGSGGPITILGTGPQSNVTLGGDIIFGSTDGLPSGDLTINTAGNVLVGGEIMSPGGADLFIGNSITPETLTLLNDVSSEGGNIFLEVTSELKTSDIDTSSVTGGFINILSEQGDVDLGDLNASGIAQGSEVTVSSGGELSTGLLNTEATNGIGGNVLLISTGILNTSDISTNANIGGSVDVSSELGDVNLGDLNTNGDELGGEVSLVSGGELKTGFINSSAINGNGGNVTLGAEQDIEVEAVNAQGGTSGGGVTVDIETAQFLRVTDSFTDQNGINASISAAGGSGNGVINIEHGGAGITPFTIGDASINGTAAAITTGMENTLLPIQLIPGSLTLSNITIRTDTESSEVLSEEVNLEEAQQERSNFSSPVIDITFNIFEDAGFTQPSEQDVLKQVEEFTNTKPVIVHLEFVEESNELDIELETSEGRYFGSRIAVDKEHLVTLIKKLYIQANTKGLPWALNNSNLSKDNNDEIHPAIALYELIIRPIEQGLELIKINQAPNKEINLVFSITELTIEPSETENEHPLLSDIPFSVLYDEKDESYLIEQYSVGLKPESTASSYATLDTQKMNVAVMIDDGTTDKSTNGLVFGSLLAKNLGRIFSDFKVAEWGLSPKRLFNLDAICELERGNFQIAHIGSHSQLSLRVTNDTPILNIDNIHQDVPCIERLEIVNNQQSTQTESYIELQGGQKLTFSAFGKLELSKLELLVLQACETARGIGLGFSGLANELGVKSVIGTLWRVTEGNGSTENMSGTYKLINDFYKNLRAGESKAEALRQAQLSFIQSGAHPHYWAGFTIVGSPW